MQKENLLRGDFTFGFIDPSKLIRRLSMLKVRKDLSWYHTKFPTVAGCNRLFHLNSNSYLFVATQLANAI